MKPYYVCNCPTCNRPKYSKAKKYPYGITLTRMKQSNCYSCSKLESNNPAYNKQKSIETRKKLSESLKGKNTWSSGRKLTDKHKEKISNSLYKSYEDNKRKPDGYLISLGMENGLARGLSRYEYEQLISSKKQYYTAVHKITKRQNIESLEHCEKRGKSKKGTNNYQLDHIIPISDGFRNNIDPEIIGNIINLRFIPWQENILRNKKII